MSSLKVDSASNPSNGSHPGPSRISAIAADNTEVQGEDVDLISTIESDLTLLIQIMSSSIHFLSNRSAHVQLNEEVPLYTPTGAGQVMASKALLDEASMAENIEELTDDLVGKVKDIEGLVEQLPKEEDEQHIREQISQLQQQFTGVNADYRSALEEATTLKSELDALLHSLCNDYQSTREQLAKSSRQINDSSV